MALCSHGCCFYTHTRRHACRPSGYSHRRCCCCCSLAPVDWVFVVGGSRSLFCRHRRAGDTAAGTTPQPICETPHARHRPPTPSTVAHSTLLSLYYSRTPHQPCPPHPLPPPPHHHFCHRQAPHRPTIDGDSHWRNCCLSTSSKSRWYNAALADIRPLGSSTTSFCSIGIHGCGRGADGGCQDEYVHVCKYMYVNRPRPTRP